MGTTNEDQIICPYCGHKCGRSVLDVYDGDEGDYECPNCFEIFRYMVEYTPIFSTCVITKEDK